MTNARPPAAGADPLRRPAPDVLDQRQQQIDPAGHHRADPNADSKASLKQPGRPGERDKGGGNA